MLLRNVNPRMGLLNGTMLQVLKTKKNYIIAKIITGKNRGYVAAIPRIDMMPSDTLLPFILKRRQFPVIVSYAMTIHKSQGQSFDKVGVFLPESVFSHGQLYVAVSRVRSPENLSIFLSEGSKGITKNIVYPELLQGLRRKIQ